jgi:hypothetical protein
MTAALNIDGKVSIDTEFLKSAVMQAARVDVRLLAITSG